jgi:hypothetical protein
MSLADPVKVSHVPKTPKPRIINSLLYKNKIL